MIASRVQPIDTLADNEPGRCSDWIARQSDNASFYDDQSVLPSCQFARAQIQPLSVDDYRHSLNPCVDRSYNDQGKNPFESRSADVGTLAYQVSLPCMESSIPIEQLQPQLQSQCSQFRDCAQNTTPKGSKNCQVGPVDVEDLALCFESDKPQTNCSLRVYRPSSSSNFRRRVKATRYGPYPGSMTNDKQFEQPGFSLMDVSPSDPPCMDWFGGQFCGYFSQPFAFCPEERWLQCPESDRCPLYDTTYSYGQNVLPPCLYEDLRNEYCQYEYNEDEQLLEDYL